MTNYIPIKLYDESREVIKPFCYKCAKYFRDYIGCKNDILSERNLHVWHDPSSVKSILYEEES